MVAYTRGCRVVTNTTSPLYKLKINCVPSPSSQLLFHLSFRPCLCAPTSCHSGPFLICLGSSAGGSPLYILQSPAARHFATVKMAAPPDKTAPVHLTSGGNNAYHNFHNDFAHIQDPNERRRLALAEIDKAPFGWYHVRACLVAGVGFFTDS